MNQSDNKMKFRHWYAAGQYVYNGKNQVVCECYNRDGLTGNEIATLICQWHQTHLERIDQKEKPS